MNHLQTNATRSALLGDAGLILFAVTLQGLFLFAMRMTLIRASRRMEYELRRDLFAHLVRLPTVTYRQTRVGDLLARATNDLDAVRNFLGPGIMYFANTVVTLVLAVALMWRIDPPLTVYALLPLPVLSLIVARLGGRLHRHYEAIQDRFAALTAKAQETLAGIRVVKAYVEEEGEYDAFRDIHHEYVEENRGMIRVWAGLWPTLSVLGGIAGAIVLWVGGSAVVSGRITLGDLVAFQIYLAMLLWPMVALGWVTNLFQRGAASMGRIQTVFEEPIEGDLDRPDGSGASREAPEEPGRAAAPAAAAANSERPTVEVAGVGFRYPGSMRWVLRDLSLGVRAGERVALVGRTGAGKTTLLGLIARLYEPTAGTIRVGGVEASALARGALRRRIGFVPQETFLFSTTLRANIAFGVEEGEQAPDVEAVALRAGLGPDLVQLPRGLDTLVGERGVTLSGGQKQRVALARALALRRPILLLDDAFASVDPVTEEAILTALFDQTHRPALLLATHRRSALLRVDRILVLDGGRVVAEGTHEELIEAGGLYAELYHQEEIVEELEVL